ncbi:MAG: YdcF family protein [Pseudomonadota bacterium]
MLFCLPWLFLRSLFPIYTPQDAPRADAALIFGAIVRDETISPLHRERLLAAAALYDLKKVEKLVVSNSPKAARIMEQFLITSGIPKDAIERDDNAERTPDTCRTELGKGTTRDILFVSQRFHLPRISLQCWQVGVYGTSVAFPTDARAHSPIAQKAYYRTIRFLRENSLIWAALFVLYPSGQE